MAEKETKTTNPRKAKRNAGFIFQSIGFGFLWAISLGIMIIGNIMLSTNFSFGEDPSYDYEIRLDLSAVNEGDKIPPEKEEFNHTEDVSGLIELYIKDSLPKNIITNLTIIKEIKIDGTEIKVEEGAIKEEIILATEKAYRVTGICYIKYDSANIVARSVLQTTSLVLVVFGIIWYTIESGKQKDPSYLREKDIIEETTEVYYPIIWQNYEDKANEKRKIKQWKANCIKQENKLDKHRRFMNKKAKEKYENDLRIWLNGTEEEKSKNDYCVTKARLRLYQTDEWIKENIKHKLVKYDQISYRLVFVGKDIVNKQDHPNEFVTKNSFGIIILDNLPRLIIGLAFSITLTLLVVDVLSFNVEAITGALLGLASMAWNTYLSYTYGKKFFNNNTYGDICFRSGIAKEYTSYIENFKEPKLPKIQEKVEVIKDEPKDPGDSPDESQTKQPNDTPIDKPE